MNLYLSMDTRGARRALKALEREGKRALKAAMKSALRSGGEQAAGISPEHGAGGFGRPPALDTRRQAFRKPCGYSRIGDGSPPAIEGNIDYSRAVEATDPYLQPASRSSGPRPSGQGC